MPPGKAPGPGAGLGDAPSGRTMRPGLELSLRILDEVPQRELVIPLLGSGLEEAELVEPCFRRLLGASEPRAPREIVRRITETSPTSIY